MNEDLLNYLVATEENNIGDVLGCLNRYGAWIEEIDASDKKTEKEIMCKISSSDMRDFETWLLSHKNIKVKITKIT
ncbi:hypothetical protein NBRC116493_02720 [Aurantivibrio infirmus]